MEIQKDRTLDSPQMSPGSPGTVPGELLGTKLTALAEGATEALRMGSKAATGGGFSGLASRLI